MSTDISTALDQKKAQPTIAQFITRLQPEISRALPRHLDGERVARLALTAVRLTPGLADCSPDSFAGSLLTAAAVGVEVGTPEAYLVPYKRECTLIIGYQGYTKLFWQHPAAQTLSAEAVYERDEFDWAKGTAPYLKHRPYRGPEGRGAVIFYYAAVSLSTGGSHFEVLTPEEVKALRGGKVGPDARFKGGDPMRWMERKTAIRQVLKPMPKSSQLSQAIVSDERGGAELYVERLAENQRPAIEAPTPGELPAGVDTETGEVADGWPDTTEPGTA